MFSSLPSVDTSSITMYFAYGLSFEYVTVTENGGTSTRLPNYQTSYTRYGLLATNTYSYVITPFNAMDNNGPSFTSPTSYSPVPVVGTPVSAVYTSPTSISVSWPSATTYATVSVSRTTTFYIGGSTTQTLVSSLAITSFIDLSQNTPAAQYTYTITPLNALAGPGTPVITAAISPTGPTVTTTGYTSAMTSSSVSFNVTGCGTTCAYVSVVRNTYLNGTVSNMSVNSTFTGTTFTDNTVTFLGDSSYNYTITPYNALGANGTSVTTTTVSPPATLTVGALTTVADIYGKNTLSFTLGSLATFYDVSMALVTNGTIGTYFVYNPYISGATYSDASSGYVGGSNYYYQITPRNAVQQLGSALVTNSVSPAIQSVTSTKNVSVIDTTGNTLVMYYPFEIIPSAVRPGYTPKYQSVVDPSSMMIYYGFDI